MTPSPAQIDSLSVNTLRFLSVDQIEKANSGHPGLPLGAAPMAYTLFARHLKFNPSNPKWLNRDRFILSAGHGSALNYALLHLFGYAVTIEDLKQFRQLGSITPGHPEYGLTPGIEATTGPLGQGFATGVGMAIAERMLHEKTEGVVDYTIYAIVSDGDLMEGVAAEAASLAGHLKLGKLVYLYDDNSISLDGPCSLSYSEDVAKRFAGYGWHVQTVTDGCDLEAISRAVDQAKSSEQPSLICVKTHIGYGSPKQDSAKAHGAPLGAEATLATKQNLGWPTDQSFYVPEECQQLAVQFQARGKDLEMQWNTRVGASSAEVQATLSSFENVLGDSAWQQALDELKFDKAIATRDAGKVALNAIADNVPFLVGGGADLASSTKTLIDGAGDFSESNRSGRNIYFGVREHAMGSAVNGIALSGMPAFGSTFLVFSDYMRGAMRLAALMKTHSIFVFSHDSVFVGEDGPTHEPIEHVASLRTIPDFKVYRPADALETVEAWRLATQKQEPCSIVLTRQNVPVLAEFQEIIRQNFEKGGFVLRREKGQLTHVLVASGSEVSMALKVADALDAEGNSVRVVSMPCQESYDLQPANYRNETIPRNAKRIALEAGRGDGWYKYVGEDGLIVSIDRFGESAPGDVVYAHLGFTPENILSRIQSHFA